ncbi:hypothetical protein AGMMS50218_14330 [Actinomycetota bacterium]|nr:hypothetical protein AGMMS50218_14330 [Actinomycetota bacterium]
MTFDLGQALRDAVERDDTGAPGGVVPGSTAMTPVGTTVGRLVARVRRRRATRATARGVVGVGAAGAVAFLGAQVVGGRGTDDLRATRGDDTANGSAVRCGDSDIALLDARTAPGLSLSRLSSAWLTTGSTASSLLMRAQQPAEDPDDLGSLVGRYLEVYSSSAAHASEITLMPADGGPVSTVRTVDASAPEIVVTRHGEVVAVGDDAAASTTMSVLTEEATPEAAVTTERSISVPLVDCAGAADGTGQPLPAGSYQVWAIGRTGVAATTVTMDDAGATTGAAGTAVPVDSGPADPTVGGVAGPYDLTLLPEAAPLDGLPDDFPADVSVVGGRLVSVKELDATDPAGWEVVVAVEGTDGMLRASRALSPAAGSPWLPGTTDELTVQKDPWQIWIRTTTPPTGPSTLTYRITPS